MSLSISSPEELEARMLSDRGIALESADAFLHPAYQLADPFLFSDMEHAVLRINSALEAKEKIAIYADYDCDGIPGAVVLVDLFKKIGYPHYMVYIPDRHEEGYGMKREAVEALAAEGVRLIITVDLGITAHDAVAHAATLGIDTVVSDHHVPLDTFPSAYAVVHPAHGSYPNREVCGAGVAFHIVRAFLEKFGESYGVSAGWEKWLLDMVGFATLSDMVPLLGENRVVASYGLSVLKKSRRVGLRELLHHLRLEQRILTEDDLTFMLAPRLNAASRMASPMRAFTLLATEDIEEAKALVAELSKINDARKTLVATTMREAEKKLEGRELPRVVVVGDVDWHPPILGLVAARLAETHERSVFVWGRNGGEEIKGSCRSDGSLNVARLMQKATECFDHFGGHVGAGGFSVKGEAVHFLEATLNEHAEHCVESGAAEVSPYPATLAVVNNSYWKKVAPFAPFGAGNAKPEFLFKNVVVRGVRQFGKGGEHLELSLEDEYGSALAISFFTGAESFGFSLAPDVRVDLTATLDPVPGRFGGGVRLRILGVTLAN